MPLNNKKDPAQLIYSVGEMTGLFHDATSLENFLQKIVEMTSEHMQSDVCSIYLYYEDRNELVLKATKGLKKESIGKVTLKFGEGLTGLALKEMRPICERNASKSPNFKFFPGIGEEKYESFLAVPIIRGQTKIGVMVIQNIKRDYFSEDDTALLKAITSQLANTIETTKLLMSLHEKNRAQEEPAGDIKLKFIKGKTGSPGFAFEEAVILEDKNDSSGLEEEHARKAYSLDDFYTAVSATAKELEELQKQIEERLSDVASLIFTAQILMLKDKDFIDAIVRLIKAKSNPPQAIREVVNLYMQMFDKLPDSYLREKKQDIKDVGTRLLKNLIGLKEKKEDIEHRIIITRDILPSEVLKLWTQNVKGIVLLSGGVTSHLCILVRSLGIPLVIADEPALLKLAARTKILLDAEVGNIYINPTAEVIQKFKERNEARGKIDLYKDEVLPQTKTKDGVEVKLQANINLLSDLKLANAFKAQGVGLYRSEFPFMVRSDFPSEEEQFVIYKKLVDGMSASPTLSEGETSPAKNAGGPGKGITFRTLDIGGDKVLSYYNNEKEENPFLGMRSIRFSLRYPDIFEQQLRAILRAGYQADIRIMFPMISSLDEFLRSKEIVEKCVKDLSKEGLNCNKTPDIGLMVELPAVLEILDELAKAADFFCIGSNDLIQYTLAVDRTNEKVADLYLPHHPTILRSLKRIVDTALAFKKDVSICGDMVHDERFLPYFLGIGLRVFSMNPGDIPRIQKAISLIDLRSAEKEAKKILSKNKISDIEEIL
ncbi:MAG: phosphoenolpyruvate--protein phosphotransferase [Omnitrophica WOR_2 bacterium GWA2_47_8]|nr:MAG: phosphoenolpyruvate--protein phosphotransferase [Omnitrophica WOR_2 bacterium GWA2_47_8]